MIVNLYLLIKHRILVLWLTEIRRTLRKLYKSERRNIILAQNSIYIKLIFLL
jgi:hypothetical protein